jgi:hypothetical protein
MMGLYSSNPNTALADIVPLLDSSSGNIAVVQSRCDRVLVVQRSALALEIQPEFQQFFISQVPYNPLLLT